KNVINLSLASQPKEIISCKIANISLEKRHIPSSSRNSAIAIANFYYDIELIYRDFLGNTHTIMHNSGYRSQRVILNTTLGSLEVELQLKIVSTHCREKIISPILKGRPLEITFIPRCYGV